MAGTTQEQKMAILRLLEILCEKTDEFHTLNATELIKALDKYDIKIDRRTVYADIEILRSLDIDILKAGDRYGGYYIGSRKFELPELKLMVDAVQASKFITVKKSEELIRKIGSLTSTAQAKSLSREVFIRSRMKAGNETIYYAVDTIHEAINRNRQLSFQYAEWTPDKKLVPKKEGQEYVVSPWAVTWSEENYYLIAYDQPSNKIKHYRVDKMLKVRLLDAAKREGAEKFRDFDLAAYSNKTFGMFGGPDESVALRCQNSLAGVILDRFGTDIMMIPDGVNHFKVRVLVSVSPQFFGWLTGIGGGIHITGPERVKQEYKEYLEEIIRLYT